jgi:hypothetical protein
MATKSITPTATAAAAEKATKKAAKGGARQVRCWQDDPGSPEAGVQPVQARVPDLAKGRLPVAIRDMGPPAGLYDPGTAEFRYWAAAEALHRSASMWGTLLPAGVTWFPSNGRKLPIALDDGEDLNAYYDRNGLHFFHASAGGRVVYSGESPDICCHELGHAVLDALRPQLWDASFLEAGAFHESFGDMSALLAALQLPSVRESVLTETAGRLYRTSRLSRLAEQLGWAIRQLRPEKVEPDCLRNAVNSFFYKDPSKLPPLGPASTLSSEPHSFSRVFTGAFLESLAGMHALQADRGPAGLLQASLDLGALLIDAVTASPLVPSYFSQIAAHVLEADAKRFQRRYTKALKSGFVKHGILSLASANSVAEFPVGAPAVRAKGLVGGSGSVSQPLMPLPGQRYGLDEDLLVPALIETKRFSVVGSTSDVDGAASPSHDEAARSFVEDLFRRDKVELTDEGEPGRAPHLSHAVRRGPDGLVLVRKSVDCGFDAYR